MGQSVEDRDLELAVRACRAAAAKMPAKRSFRLLVLLQMLQGELEKERALRRHGCEDPSSDVP